MSEVEEMLSTLDPMSEHGVFRRQQHRLTWTVQEPELEGWKKDSVLVIKRSKASRALEPALKPVCLVSSRSSPSIAIE